jgi:hypothetical protein
MAQLRHNRTDLQALIGTTADALRIDQIFVEKDFWVTEVLRAATSPVELVASDGSRNPVSTIFKGGTSLSRIYGLIERFSEDVDLLIGFPPVDAGTGAKDKVLKAIRDQVATHLNLVPANVIAGPATRGVKRNITYAYPAFGYGRHEAVKPGVLLEMGCRGGTYPVHHRQLRSMIADHAIGVLGESPDVWEEFAPVSVQVLAPERTLLEKLAFLHDCASRSPSEDAHGRLLTGARHLYDVQRLLSSEQVIATLTDLGPERVAELCADIERHSRDAEFSSTPRPDGGYGDSPLMDPSRAFHSALAQGYATAMALVYGEKPTVDECITTIRGHAELL